MSNKAVTHFEAVFGVRDIDPELLLLALTHRSYAYEHGGIPTNERLEFLGDAVLSVVITAALYRSHPDLPEGQLARLRAGVVNQKALAGVARRMGAGGVGPHLKLGKGEEATGGREKNSILADAVEALLGAIYLQYGMDTSERVIHQLFDPMMDRAIHQGAALDWKTSLQELTAESSLGVPEYRITESGPDHAKKFTAWAVVRGEEFGQGTGPSKKEAEQIAAELAWRVLNERYGPRD
ncbi:ribonuclease III [Natronoglycomyces albus]|uniref:Ribonuclease 3 n=1 Tax=Natronoglycomyces albus TaxID=2811108 RepID=A0A895XVD8_9ACTN|nr:ribonuclease III [Natronoglycomyces albus]QSB06190.1 ribonuclease III [Natronoglycomyces albus]